jgi:asparagine synthetase B (glutamine-hydrolysing)
MFYRMDPLELAGGWVHGFDATPMPPHPGAGPRAVLERSLLSCLVRQPCMVAFSGGRDSSAVLAVAVHVARREGLPLPIPVTLRYRDAPGSEESHWQDLVLDHLGVREHQLVIAVGDEHDPIGPIAAPLLRRHGVVWPPNFTPMWRIMDVARGGVMLTGECGDEVLGRRRIAPVANVLRVLKAGRRPSRQLCLNALRAVAPTPVRRRREFQNRYVQPWLREPVQALLERRIADDRLAYSLHAGRQTWQYVTRRAVRRMLESMHTFAAEIDVEYHAPLDEPEFVSSLAHAMGLWGWRSRTAAMNRLFGDVLPPALLQRTTKAHFGHAVFTEHTREFARQWDGSGVDDSLVDPEALRANWLSELPHLPTMGLLQTAWLAGQPTAPAATAPESAHQLGPLPA